MKKIKRLIYAFALGMLITSCGPPDTFEKGADFYQAQKYDSAMYYFDRLLPEDKDWLDSSNAMKKLCFEKIILAHNWELYNSQLDIYGKDSLLMNLADKDLEEELINMSRKDSTQAFYKVYDTYKDRFNPKVLNSAMNNHIDDFLKDYSWNGTSRVLSKNKLKYEINSENVRQLISFINSGSGWSKDKVLYKEIEYLKEGKFSMKPRIFRGGSSYFGRKGSLTFIGKDSLSVNYGTRDIAKQTFIRGDKLEAVLSKK